MNYNSGSLASTPQFIVTATAVREGARNIGNIEVPEYFPLQGDLPPVCDIPTSISHAKQPPAYLPLKMVLSEVASRDHTIPVSSEQQSDFDNIELTPLTTFKTHGESCNIKQRYYPYVMKKTVNFKGRGHNKPQKQMQETYDLLYRCSQTPSENYRTSINETILTSDKVHVEAKCSILKKNMILCNSDEPNSSKDQNQYHSKDLFMSPQQNKNLQPENDDFINNGSLLSQNKNEKANNTLLNPYSIPCKKLRFVNTYREETSEEDQIMKKYTYNCNNLKTLEFWNKTNLTGLEQDECFVHSEQQYIDNSEVPNIRKTTASLEHLSEMHLLTTTLDTSKCDSTDDNLHITSSKNVKLPYSEESVDGYYESSPSDSTCTSEDPYSLTSSYSSSISLKESDQNNNDNESREFIWRPVLLNNINSNYQQETHY